VSFDPNDFPLRAPCRHCGHDRGAVIVKGGQNCAHCRECTAFAGYNVPKTETGEVPRTVSTVRNGIKPRQRIRVLERDGGQCVACGAIGQLMHVAHIVSVKDAFAFGLSDDETNDDENLAALCEECNLGMAALSFRPKMLLAILLRRWRDRPRETSR
jgi:hypothetical protein